ncbi:cyclin-like protein [Chlamydoabsidia padenii]|nr:cyclin-like protein [Chlamydoabsidia padenii]
MINDQWLYSKDELLDTPSIADGITFEQEQMDRTKGCHYLLAVAARLNLPQLVVATATTFFHRFFMRHSMKRFHIYDMAATSLFVAAKVEENTRRIKDFVNACAQKAAKNDKLVLNEDSKDFVRWKETMLFNEVILLETLCFDLTIEHPHLYLEYLETQLNISGSMLRKAWMLLYQCSGSPLCLLYQSNVIAGAVLLLASYMSSDTLKEGWWNDVHLDGPTIHEIASDMLGYYTDHYVKKSSTPVVSSSVPSTSGASSPQAQSPYHPVHPPQHNNHTTNPPL